MNQTNIKPNVSHQLPWLDLAKVPRILFRCSKKDTYKAHLKRGQSSALVSKTAAAYGQSKTGAYSQKLRELDPQTIKSLVASHLWGSGGTPKPQKNELHPFFSSTDSLNLYQFGYFDEKATGPDAELFVIDGQEAIRRGAQVIRAGDVIRTFTPSDFTSSSLNIANIHGKSVTGIAADNRSRQEYFQDVYDRELLIFGHLPTESVLLGVNFQKFKKAVIEPARNLQPDFDVYRCISTKLKLSEKNSRAENSRAIAKQILISLNRAGPLPGWQIKNWNAALAAMAVHAEKHLRI